MSKKSTVLNGRTLEELRLPPQNLDIITDPAHPLYQARALWDVDPGLVESMQREGFTSTVLVGEQYEEGVFISYVVIAGRQRTKAAVAAGIQDIPCLNIGDIALLSNSELQALMIGENERRTQNNTLERAEEAFKLYSTKLQELMPKDWPSEVPWKPSKAEKSEALEFTGKAFNLAPGRITNMFALLDEDKVSGGLKKAIRDGQLSFKAALTMVKLNPIEQEEKLALLAPVREKKEKEHKASGGKKSKSLSEKEVNAVVNPANNFIRLKREWVEKILSRRSTPRDVKDFCKELLNPDSTDLPYLPGRIDKLKAVPAIGPGDDE